MDGFDCDFTEEPPKYLQTHCPICLLILREPFQVTCCGKSFCRTCIQRIRAEYKPCPTCNQDNFNSFQNKGLQQPLYGFQVFCSNKESGCDWQGELRKLDKHLNSNPDKDNLSVGCIFVGNVQCTFCNVSYQRSKIECHQDSQCAQRPFTCSMCQEFKSTYDDVITNHAPVCKWRPVECPNSCGAKNLQHQHLEEHVSTQCPLSYVECEFSDAGCDGKVHRKDLPSHLGENMATHVSLLARENRKLKLQLKQQEKQLRKQEQQLKQQEQQQEQQLKQQEQQHKQQEQQQEQQHKQQEQQLKQQEQQLKQQKQQLKQQKQHLKQQKQQLKQQEQQLKQQKQQLKQQEQQLKQQKQQLKQQKQQFKQQEQQLKQQNFRFRVPSIRLECVKSILLGRRGWVSEPFYSHIGGYKLRLFTYIIISDHFSCVYLENEFPVALPCKQQITMTIMDQDNDKNSHKIIREYTVTKYNTLSTICRANGITDKYMKNDKLVICVDEIKTL